MSWTFSDDQHEASARALGGGTRLAVRLGDDDVLEVSVAIDRDGTLVLTMPGGRVARAAVSRDGDARWVTAGGRTWRATRSLGPRRAGAEHHGDLEAPMPGRIVRVAVAVGDVVEKGQTVITLEAMKMEHALKAPRDGVVQAVRCEEGELVQPGVALVVLGEAMQTGAAGDTADEESA